MKRVVRLNGSDAEVRAIGEAAVTALQENPKEAAWLFRRLWRLHERRRAFVARAGAQPVARRAAEAAGEFRAAYRALWGALLGIGLVGALISAIMLAPADRKNAFLDPDIALSVALIAGGIAFPVLLIVLLLRVPDQRSAEVAQVLSALVGIVCAGILFYRMVVGAGEGRGLDAADLASWMPQAVVIVLLLIGVSVRTSMVRRRSVDTAHRAGTADQTRQLRRDARWLAASGPSDARSRAAWIEHVDALEISPETARRARSMTPAAWLAWLAYDGESDIREVIPRS